MGLFDWFSGLFSSSSDAENKNSENNIESDDGKIVEANRHEKNEAQDQVNNDLEIQEELKAESEKIESEKQEIAEADVQHEDDKVPH